jgi:hypothetical protein
MARPKGGYLPRRYTINHSVLLTPEQSAEVTRVCDHLGLVKTGYMRMAVLERTRKVMKEIEGDEA